jgi:hypothetical protein
MNFTLEELQAEIEPFPKGGFFDLGADGNSSAIFYDFVCDTSFRIPEDCYETIDLMVGTSWIPIAQIDFIEEINKCIESGEFTRFRYIVLAN